MIKIPQPAMVWNASNALRRFEMQNTRSVERHDSIANLCDDTSIVLNSFKKYYPRYRYTLVINCHGGYRDDKGGFGLDIGQGIANVEHAAPFKKLATLVDIIVIVACGAAAVTIPGGLLEADAEGYPAGSGDGGMLCKAIAQNAQALTWAQSNMLICSTVKAVPRYYIPAWQGPVKSWRPDGVELPTVTFPTYVE